MHTKKIENSADLSRTQSWHHNRLTIVIHWLVALLLPVMAGLGWYMLSIENQPGSSWYFDLHKSLGMVFGMLVLIRLVWRFFHPLEPLPRSVPLWQAQLARWMQGLLYVAMILMPITGYLGSAFGPDSMSFFGLNLPKWLLPNHAIAELIFNIHGVVIWVLISLVSIHVLGALKHLLVDKDGIFQRMWFK